MVRDERTLPIAVIGAGFSGTVAAVQLLAALPRERPILLCERGGSFGRGLAYATPNTGHLLNVRAANMSAFPDRPRHFESWLNRLSSDPASDEAAGIRVTPAGTFAARGLYGRYLSELLRDAVTGGEGAPRLHLVNDTVVDLEPADFGFVLRMEGGQRYPAAGAVLAMGNVSGPSRTRSRHRVDPWNPDSFGRLHPDRPVLIAGTGLTMVDAVVALRRHGFAGPILAVSRRGLLPHPHAPAVTWPRPDFSECELRSLIALLARIRAEVAAARAAGVEWHGVIDGLRPITDAVWRALPRSERARFLRHLRPFWDTHRHRMAPPTADLIAAELALGSLTIRAGRIVSIADEASQALVTLRLRGGQREDIAVQCIVDATGIGLITETENSLVRNLMARGLVRPGPFNLGLDAESCRILGPRPSDRLWILGPLLRGVLQECTAVPDIRNQAADVAESVADSFKDEANEGARQRVGLASRFA